MFLLSPLCCRSRTGVWVIMVHYRQGTFHCYVLSCVVSGDKRTTILISVRRRNTWLEPMKSAFSFCHWLRPSGPNKVFPFESTAVRNFMETLLLCVSVNLRSLFKARRVCFMALSFLCQVWSVLTEGKKTKQNKTRLLICTCFSSRLPSRSALPSLSAALPASLIEGLAISVNLSGSDSFTTRALHWWVPSLTERRARTPTHKTIKRKIEWEGWRGLNNGSRLGKNNRCVSLTESYGEKGAGARQFFIVSSLTLLSLF